MPNENKRLVVNLNPDLDPDFGEIRPSGANAFLVSISPTRDKSERPNLGFFCIVLIPESESVDHSRALVQDILQHFLQEGDYFEIRTFGSEDLELYAKDTPVVGYDPKRVFLDGAKITDSFFWLTPPRALMQ